LLINLLKKCLETICQLKKPVQVWGVSEDKNGCFPQVVKEKTGAIATSLK
jgi:hypothetical protein